MSEYGGAPPPPPGPPPPGPPPPTPPSPTPPDASLPGRPRRGRRRTVIIVVAVLVVLIGGAAYGAVWYTQPQRAIVAGVADALTAPVSLTRVHFEVGDDEGGVQLDGTLARDEQALQADLQASLTAVDPTLEVNLPIQLAANEQAAYLRVRGLQEAYDEMTPSLLAAQLAQEPADLLTLGIAQSILDTVIQPLLDQVDAQWIEVDRQGLADLGGQAFRCDQVELALSPHDRAQLARTYQDHPPFTIRKELGSRDGADGYLLTPNEEGLQSLLRTFQDTDLARTLRGCTGTDGQPGSGPLVDLLAAAHIDELQVRVWVDRWSHEISELSVTRTEGDARLQLQLRPQYGEPVSVQIPTNAVSLSEVVRSLRESLEGIAELLDATAAEMEDDDPTAEGSAAEAGAAGANTGVSGFG